jgi:signal transduction histidine kinase
LREHLESFQQGSGIATRLVVRGDPTLLTVSQRLALFSLVREGLANVREHSGATAATVSVSVRRAWTHASIADNGCGFDVDRTLGHAIRRGRLGLLGMSERIRLLGGRLELDSSPGGPTTITVAIPRWQALPESEPSVSAQGIDRIAAQTPVVGTASAA